MRQVPYLRRHGDSAGIQSTPIFPWHAIPFVQSSPSSPEVADLIQRVGQSLARHCAAGAGAVRLDGPLQWRINSALFRAHGPALPVALAVKACFLPRSSAPATDLARQQFDALARVHAKMGSDARLNVPRPVYCDEAAGVMAVEWLEGATLTERLGFSPGLLRADRLLRASGEWLCRFHQAGLVPDTSFDDWHKEGVLVEFAADPMAAEPVFRAGVAALQARLAVVAALPHRRSWVHGDYKCDNVFVCPGRLAGIDITLHLESSPVVYDAAQFLNHLALLTHAPTRPYLRPLAGWLERAFVAGYADGGARLDPLALAWVRLFMMLSLWRTEQGQGQRGLRHRVVQSLVRGRCAALRRALERL
jgi:tRNA A-37 threonylcarbamoyl transferase component Bud32